MNCFLKLHSNKKIRKSILKRRHVYMYSSYKQFVLQGFEFKSDLGTYTIKLSR